MSELLQAILQQSGDLDRLLKDSRIDERQRRCVALRRHMTRGDWRRGGLAATQDLVRQVTDEPPDDTALYQMALGAVAMVAMQRGHRDHAREVLDLASGLGSPSDPPEVTAYILAERARLADISGDAAQGLELLNQAMDLPLPVAEPMWLFVKTCRAAMAAENYRFDLARADLADLSGAQESQAARSYPLAYTRMLVAGAAGELQEALTQVSKAFGVPGGVDPKRLTSWRVELLIRLDRLDEATNVLQSDAGRELGPVARDNLQALACLAQGRLDQARSHLGSAVGAGQQGSTAYEQEMTRRLLLELELACGQMRPARRALAELDPQRQSPTTLAPRARLALLEGNPDEAASLLARLWRLGGRRLVADQLRLAWELPAARLSLLLERIVSEVPQAGSESVETVDHSAAVVDDGAVVQLVGASRATEALRREVRRLAPLEATVLLVGATGTGKEVVARLLHRLGPRADKPFVPVNCGGLSEALVESELFGHEQGAFTGAVRARRGLFEVAEGGTILLDEIHAMPERLQASLLRTLETGEVRRIGANSTGRVNVRVIAAANDSLDRAVAEGRFREDLYYRLSQLRLDLPPLRERAEDIRPLVEHFLASRFGRYEVVIADELIEAMCRLDWPGNVRQLKHAVHRIALLAGDRRVLGPELLDVKAPGAERESTGASDPPQTEPLDEPPRSCDTLARRRYIRRLFCHEVQLTRAEIIRRVGCAPNTATRDLRELERQGLIRRVRTSGHLRTSYFQWTGKKSDPPHRP